nr:MAG TPA: hypothetical protein [Caudoviricetes sp.]
MKRKQGEYFKNSAILGGVEVERGVKNVKSRMQ